MSLVRSPYLDITPHFFWTTGLVSRSQPRRYRQISVMNASYRILDLIAERPEFLLSVENKTHS